MYVFGAASVTQYCACGIHPCCLQLEFVHFHCCNRLSVWLFDHLFIHPTVDRHVACSHLGFYRIHMNMYVLHPGTYLHAILLSKWLEVELLGHRVWVSSILIDNTDLFTIGCTSFSFHQQCMNRVLVVRHPQPCLSVCLTLATPVGGWLSVYPSYCYLHFPNFTCIFLVECLSLICWPSEFVLLWSAYSSSCTFFYWVICFCFVLPSYWFLGALYNQATSLVSYMSGKYLSPLWSCLLTMKLPFL